MEDIIREIDNPSLKVRRSSRFISKNLKHIKINNEKLREFSLWVSEQKFDEFADSSNHPKKEELNLEEQIRFVFIVDTLNFCFWPNSMEYEDLTLFVKNGIKDKKLQNFDCDFFLNLQKKDFLDLFSKLFKTDPFVQLEERFRILKELSFVIKNKFGNSFLNFLENSDFCASKLLNLILMNFTNFQDHAVYKGRQVFFYKRAQILVGDINEALLSYCKHFETLTNTEKNYLEKFNKNKKLENLELLTSFADYRVPQVLNYKEIIIYSESLQKAVQNGIQLAPCSEEEIEIRGVMIFLVSEVVRILKEDFYKDFLDIEVDWILWQYGEKFVKYKFPHHKVLGIFY